MDRLGYLPLPSGWTEWTEAGPATPPEGDRQRVPKRFRGSVDVVGEQSNPVPLLKKAAEAASKIVDIERRVGEPTRMRDASCPFLDALDASELAELKGGESC